MMKMTWLAVGLAAVGCGGGTKEMKADVAAAPPAATATLEAKSGSQASGSAALSPLPDGTVQIVIKVAGAAPGAHGLHLHATGDCSAPDAASAGPHYNPDNVAHGAPDHPPHHAGDLGNIQVGADGSGTLTAAVKDATLDAGPRSLIGKAVVLHEKADDLTSQPAGNSGARIACGVIAAAKP
jgi:Cu-Zn family superoxide dismutase